MFSVPTRSRMGQGPWWPRLSICLKLFRPSHSSGFSQRLSTPGGVFKSPGDFHKHTFAQAPPPWSWILLVGGGAQTLVF